MRVLIVAPRFAPNNAADSHRVRLLLPYLRSNGCAAEVLAVDPRDIKGPVDLWLAEQLPADVPVHHVRAWPLRFWGLDGLAQRAIVPLYLRGATLLAERKFDLIFFSTTEFLVHILGPIWKKFYGVRFCMDFQDPWVNDYYRVNKSVEPPGGRLKYNLIAWIHCRAERFVVPRCSGFLAVSERYLQALGSRYGETATQQPRLVKPFPAEPRESKFVQATVLRKGVCGSGRRLIRYIGRGGPDMSISGSAFFGVWSALLSDKRLQKDALFFEAIGTTYEVGDHLSPSFAPLASRCGLLDHITEQPSRLGYRDMLLALYDSDALVVFGSNDPAYTASKIFPYLLADRPLLAIFHEESPVVSLIEEVGGGRCATFGSNGLCASGAEIIKEFLMEVAAGGGLRPLNRGLFLAYGAEAQAASLVEWFGSVLSRVGENSA